MVVKFNAWRDTVEKLPCLFLMTPNLYFTSFNTKTLGKFGSLYYSVLLSAGLKNKKD